MDTSHLGSIVPTIPDGSTTLLCPKLFRMTSDLISLEVLMGFTFSMAMVLALFHFNSDRFSYLDSCTQAGKSKA